MVAREVLPPVGDPQPLCRNIMKVVIQNDCEHALTRRQLESMINFFPSSWSKGVNTIALYQGKEPAITAKYYEKEKILGLFCPKDAQTENDKQLHALQELFIGLECIAENHTLPKNISTSMRNHLVERTASINKKCMSIVSKSLT